MAQHTLEERVTTLEQQIAKLKAAVKNGISEKDWQRTVGMFSGDEDMKRIDQEGRKWREAERRKARRKQGKRRQKKS